MIPFVAVVSVPHRRSRTFRLSIPMFLLWLFAVPAMLILSPLILLLCLVCWINPFLAFSVIWQILEALRDTNVEIAHRSASVSICIL
jgi:hypothetical protein